MRIRGNRNLERRLPGRRVCGEELNALTVALVGMPESACFALMSYTFV